MTKLSIVYATDDNYVQHVTVSIVSLLKTAKDISLYELFLLDNNISEINKEKLLQTIGKYNTTIHFINISNIHKKLPQGIDTANLSISTYSRLFLAELLPLEVEKVLYLDCDTVVMQDLTILSDFPLDNYIVCGVEDMMYPYMKEEIGLTPKDRYINAGVLLVNLKRWREENVTKKFLYFIERFKGKVPHLDQGVINGVLQDRYILPLAYNVQSPIYAIYKYKNLLKFHSIESYYSEYEVKCARKSPIILHYTKFFLERPWFQFCLHPKKDIYRKLLKETPFAQNSLQRGKFGWKRKVKMIAFRYMQPLYLTLKFKQL